MKQLKLALASGVIAFGTMIGCSRQQPVEDVPLPRERGNLAKELTEASRTRTDSQPVYHHYVTRFRTKLVELENKAMALHRAAEKAKIRDIAGLMDAIAEFDTLVQQGRAELEALQNQGPTPNWEGARDRTARAIVSAESSFDRLAIHYRVTQVENKDTR